MFWLRQSVGKFEIKKKQEENFLQICDKKNLPRFVVGYDFYPPPNHGRSYINWYVF